MRWHLNAVHAAANPTADLLEEAFSMTPVSYASIWTAPHHSPIMRGRNFRMALVCCAWGSLGVLGERIFCVINCEATRAAGRIR